MVGLLSLFENVTPEKNEKQIKKSSEDKNSSLWSQLPMNLSRQTMEKLCFADQIRLNGICKRWLYPDQYRKPSGSLPCFATVKKLRNESLQCQLYESSNVNPFSVDKIDLRRFRIVADSLYCACKHGWLFFSMINWCSSSSITNFLLYSSVTKNIITLPAFVHSKNHHYSKFVQAFSADPGSPDCVFLILHYDVEIDNRITISTCHLGDKEWTSREYDRGDINFMCFGSTPVYLHGNFYFVSAVGEVASYSIALGEWKTVRNLFNGITHCNTGYEAFELNGELGLIYFYDDEYLKRNDRAKLGYIRMFDRSGKIWIRLKSLGDEALYVSSNTFSVSAVGEAARNNGIFPNKIYRPHKSGCISVYSLVDGDLFRFNNSPASTNREKVSSCWEKFTFWVESRDQLEKQRQSRVESMENKRKKQSIEADEVKDGMFVDDS